MTVALGTLSTNDGKNSPGYKKLYAIYDQDIETIPAASSMDVGSAVTLASMKIWKEIVFDHESGCFLTIEEPESEGGTGYTYTLQGFIAGDTAAIRTAVETFDGVPCVFIGEKLDGTLDIIGETDKGIRLRFNKEDAGRAGNRIGYAFSGSMDYDHLPYTYSDGTITTS